MSRMSVATIDKPEFINLEPLEINPLMSKCDIKVLYIGENRNQTFISKEVATEMAKTLRGAPIVGYFREDKEDFRDHGDKITIDESGVQFDCLTKPYGFVSPDAQVWFQTFVDTDDFGNEETREYLMTTGYLWTGQYEEAKLPIEEGRPQSMELDPETLEGKWAENSKTGIEFFIINDAIFSKLCILGEDVEPCFEGAEVASAKSQTSFTLDDNFTKNLYNMMQQLKFALEGRPSMELENQTSEENFSDEMVNTDEVEIEKNEESIEEVSQEESSYVKKNEEEEKEASQEEKETDSSEEEETDDEDASQEEEEKKKYSLLESQYEDLKTQFAALETRYQELVSFKNDVENQKKDDLINSFYMLSEEDKKDVIENKTSYSLEDIEAKLSVIYTKRQLAAAETAKENENDNKVLTYTFKDESASTPDWVKAVRETEETL